MTKERAPRFYAEGSFSPWDFGFRIRDASTDLGLGVGV
jgi:hypothetical protein